MLTPEDVLLFDVGLQPMHVLAARLQRLGFRTLRVKTPNEARDLLADPRYRVGVAILPPDIPAANLASALQSLRGLSPRGDLTFLAAGLRPDGGTRARLAKAGVESGLWEPIDQHTLRFLLNRATAGATKIERERTTIRVPTDWPVRLRSGSREKPARVYSISANGAYFATPRPSLRDSLVHLSLPLPGGPVRTAGKVVMTNVPGNLLRGNLPIGMGVRFTGTAHDVEAAIQVFVEQRNRELGL